jgi:hypothetical protein
MRAKNQAIISISLITLSLTVFISTGHAALSAPVLKWTRGGCYSSWCETGWYSSPALADVNKDGIQDVIASAYTVFALNGLNGNLIWRAGNTNNRTWPGIAVADIDKNGSLEVVTAQSGGYLTVYGIDGVIKWQKRPVTNELRGLLVADLDSNSSTLELVVTAARGSAINAWVYNSNGSVRSGWPQLSSTNGYAWGVYSANAAAGNLDSSDAKLELIVPSDVHYINGYKPNGSLLPINTTAFPGKTYWGQVGVWESPLIEKRGWGACDGNRSESYRANFAEGPAVIADLNNDGKREVVVMGNMYDCYAGYPPSRYTALFLFNKDRTRFTAPGYNWQSIPVNTGAPLSEDYNLIESAQSNPVVADLDGDGKKEILYASYDGRMHAVWLDKLNHGYWPYSVYSATENAIRFASEPLVADLDGNGKAEVIFTSWVQKGLNRTGKLHILNDIGQKLFEVNLPTAVGSDWNGGMAAPTLGNIDQDQDLEIVINTAHSGIIAYDLPGTAKAIIHWGTGRGSFQRTAAR